MLVAGRVTPQCTCQTNAVHPRLHFCALFHHSLWSGEPSATVYSVVEFFLHPNEQWLNMENMTSWWLHKIKSTSIKTQEITNYPSFNWRSVGTSKQQNSFLVVIMKNLFLKPPSATMSSDPFGQVLMMSCERALAHFVSRCWWTRHQILMKVEVSTGYMPIKMFLRKDCR